MPLLVRAHDLKLLHTAKPGSDMQQWAGDACLQGGAVYENNCVSNNVKNSVFNGNKAQQGSGIYLNNSLPVRASGCMRGLLLGLATHGTQ